MSATPPVGSTETKHVAMAILGVMFGLLLSMLDNFIVGTALPSIIRELGGASLLAWVVTVYALTTAVTTPIWAKLGDLFGRKRVFQLAVVLFIAGSIFAAAVPSMSLLVAARAFQGIGAGGLAVSAFAVIGDLVPPRERGKYQGMTAIVVAAGTVGGPLLGGFVTDGLGWRWAFLINLPLGALAIVWVALFLKLPAVHRHARIDWTGAALLGVAVAVLVLLTKWAGTEFDWVSAPSLALVGVTVAAITTFIWWELRVSEPLIPLVVFRSRSFTMASILAFLSGAVVFAAVLYLPLYQQNVQGASASESGLLLLPMMVPVVIVSLIAGRVMTRTGKYKVFPIIGTISLTIGSVLLATMTTSTPIVVTALFMVFMGAGSGLVQQMTTMIAQNSVDQGDIGAASGVVTLLRTLGGSIAVAIFGSIYSSHTTDLAGDALNGGVASSTHVIFTIVAAAAALGLVAAIAVREFPLRGRPLTPPATLPTEHANSSSYS